MEARSWAPRGHLCPSGSMLLAFASLLGCLLTSSQARVYSRCELAKVLQDFGMEGYRGYTLADWVCLAYFTSGFNTAAVDHEADGSTNNGIFQINSRKWCKNLNTEVPNVCQMYCSGRLGLSPRQPPWTNLCFYPLWVLHPSDLGSWMEGCSENFRSVGRRVID
uniref:Sperm acrosome membrane-associated protein 3 n=1 Tax=Canis lupus familiaris TaxID=9615 RepID=A0A8I3RWM2_CANLF